MTVYRRCRFLIVAAAAAAVVLAYFVSSEVESRLVRERVEALMAPAVNDMREEMLAGADPILYYLANCIQRDLPTVAAAASSPQKVTALMRTYALDEINFARRREARAVARRSKREVVQIVRKREFGVFAIGEIPS